MTITGPVPQSTGLPASFIKSGSGYIYLKADVAGKPTDTEFTNASVTNINDSLIVVNTVDLKIYARMAGQWSAIGQANYRQETSSTYNVWYDGLNYHADAMKTQTDTSNASASTTIQSALNNA